MGDLMLFYGQIQPQEGKREEDSQKAPRPPPSHQKCPRCWSTNTKFCYYSCSQPRYFCKDCKRYWTLGGSPRDVPLGGYTRRDKRSKKAMGTPDDNNIQETTPPGQGVYQSSVISSLNPASSFPEASGLGLPPL